MMKRFNLVDFNAYFGRVIILHDYTKNSLLRPLRKYFCIHLSPSSVLVRIGDRTDQGPVQNSGIVYIIKHGTERG